MGVSRLQGLEAPGNRAPCRAKNRPTAICRDACAGMSIGYRTLRLWLWADFFDGASMRQTLASMRRSPPSMRRYATSTPRGFPSVQQLAASVRHVIPSCTLAEMWIRAYPVYAIAADRYSGRSPGKAVHGCHRKQ